MSQKISVLEERADSGKRAVPGKASNSEKRHVSEKVTVREDSIPRDAVRTPSTDAKAKAPSLTRSLPTFSSTLQCSSPHARMSLDTMRPRRDSSKVALSHSTIVRLLARSVKIDLKVEQYLSALERSEFIRDANRFHAEFPVAPVDVTSKRHLFEKKLVGQSREGPAISCKENLELSGLKSQLSLWISRTQESAQQGPQNQETQRDLAARSKPQWRKKPEALLGAEVSGGPGIVAALLGECCLAGTHSPTARLAGGPGGQVTYRLLEAVCCREDT
ncbi:ladinin-1-like [Ovis canadensis]|uniref:ladinin-1-like n=1 Tax=Ovis canadensis TaxID=37174 RepID=UPI003751817D